MTKPVRGAVFRAQGYSLQDGPGLRTTIFLKGCPLRCKWCHNPESIDARPELMTHDVKCLLCGKCAGACPEGAITVAPGRSRKIDREKCTRCFKCVPACPAGALEVVGEYVTVEQVMAEIEKDELFYRHSGGGVTISGGEPLLQPEFLNAVLSECKARNLYTALDTSGYAHWPALEHVLPLVDLVLYDLKHANPRSHEKGTGVGNALILENLRRIPHPKKIWLRVPLIPGFNDSPENIRETVRIGLEIGAEKISLLPYHDIAVGKYASLGKCYALPELTPPDKDHVEDLRRLCEDAGLSCTVGY